MPPNNPKADLERLLLHPFLNRPGASARLIGLLRESRMEMSEACFRFLPTRAALDLQGWPEIDIFAHS